MIARLLRALWIVAIVVAAGASWWLIHRFGSRIGPWAAGLAGVLVVAALHPAAIAFNFVVSRVVGDPVPPEYRLSPWRAIATFDAEIDASMRGLWFATPFLAHRPAPRPPMATTDALPILFVHGYFCNRAVWLSFMRDAASRGHVCEAITLDDPFASIDSHTEVVDRAIDALLIEAHALGVEAAQVAIVAHSMGGLVARAALQRIDASRVAQVVTLGTPHHGCLSARFGNAAGVVQMRRISAWRDDLEAREANGDRGVPRARFTTLFSHHDDIVFPQETAVLDGAHRIAIGGCGHVALLFDPRVRTLVFERLASVGTDAGRFGDRPGQTTDSPTGQPTGVVDGS